MATMQAALPLVAGTQIDEYLIDRVLERGRYGYTYLVRDSARREFALSEFLPHEFAERVDGSMRPRDAEDRNPLRFWLRSFLDLARQLAALNHRSLPRQVRQFEANGTGYAVAEFQPGESLQTRLDREGTIDESVLTRILVGVLGGMEQAHDAGLLHRDLSPEHIWLRASDGGPQLRHFSALRAPIRLKARILTGAGSPPYVAPEEYSANAAQGAFTDLYALGAVAYRAVSGELPPSAQERRKGAPLPAVADIASTRCSPALASAIEWSLALPAADRPQSISAWREALRIEIPMERVAQPAPERVAAAKPGAGRFALPAIGLLAIAAAVGYLLMPKTPTNAQPVASAAPITARTSAAESASTAANDDADSTANNEEAGSSSLDRLGVDLITRDRKAQELRDQQRLQQEARDAQARAAKATAEVAARPAPQAAPPAAPPTVPEDVTAAARARLLEEELARLRAERDAQKVGDDEARVRREQLASEAAAKLKADRDSQALIIAKARKNCRLAAADLSSAGNLTFETALRVPGAEQISASIIRLPPVTLADGRIEVFEITPDSCARRSR